MKNCRLLKRIFLAVMFGISMELVSACGGSAGEQEPASAKPVSTRDVRPSLAADTSGIAIAASVTKIESPLATAEIGKNVAVFDGNGKSENVIFAVDDAGEVIFIGSDSGNQAIGIETTAKYLAWMGLLVSDNPADSPVDQVRPLLMATKSYAALVSAVKSELSNGIPISKSNILGDYISDVVLEAQLVYAESVKNSPAAQTQAVNNVSQLDYYVIDRDGDEKFWISNKDAQNITLNNRTFLFWTAQSKNIENNQLIAASTLVLPLKTTQSQLYAYYEGSESKTQLGTAPHTEIKIEQDYQSINANAMMLVTRSTFAIIDISMVALGGSSTNMQKCVVGVAKNITNNPKFALFVSRPSNDGFVNFLHSIDAVDSIQRGLECSNAKYITNNLWYQSINRSLAPIRAGRSANSAFGTLAQLVRYSTRSDTFELCRYAGAVAPCVRRLAGPAEVTIGGESSTIYVSAFGDLDVPIVSPPSLTLKSTDPSIFTVDPVNSGGNISIKGVANGTAQLVVTEPVTGVALAPAITIKVSGVGDQYWVGTYKSTSCTPFPADGYNNWSWESPCFINGPVASSDQGYFYFDDKSHDVVLGSNVGGAEDVRRIFPLNWKSIDSKFELSIPTGYSLALNFSIYKGSGVRSTVFTVTTRNQKTMSGTFVVNTISGYYSQSSSGNEWMTIPTTASGVWTANLVNGKRPQTQMNGFDFCFSNNVAAKQAEVGAINPYSMPIWGGGVENGCVFGK